jgi:photosystem II stability/assembly factor-like uncharacterized protein
MISKFITTTVLLMAFNHIAHSQWQNITGNIQLPIGGVDRKKSIVISPTNNIYLSLQSGIYHSGDDGNTWSNVLPQPANQGVLAYGGNTLYAANNKNNLNDTSFFVTSDNGINWQKSIRVGGALSYSNAILYFNDTLFLSLAGSGAGNGSVFFTTDNGTTWQNTNAPVGSDVLDMVTGDNEIFISRDYFGVYRFVNNGSNSWTQLSTAGLPLCLGSPCAGTPLC